MAEVVQYALDDGSVVLFEIEPSDGFVEASRDRVVGRIREAVRPALRAAREVLDQAKEYAPSEVEVKFGIKVSGKMDWLVAKAATEGSFDVTLKWKPETQVQRQAETTDS